MTAKVPEHLSLAGLSHKGAAKKRLETLEAMDAEKVPALRDIDVSKYPVGKARDTASKIRIDMNSRRLLRALAAHLSPHGIKMPMEQANAIALREYIKTLQAKEKA